MPGLVTRGLGMKLQITIQGGGGGGSQGNNNSGPAVDLTDAIRLFFEGIPALVAAVPGGIYTGAAGANTKGTYVVIQDCSGRLELQTDILEVHDTRVHFKVYDPDLDVAGQVGDQIYAAFRKQKFEWTTGKANRFIPVNRKQVKPPGYSKGTGSYEYYFLVEFQTRVIRQLGSN